LAENDAEPLRAPHRVFVFCLADFAFLTKDDPGEQIRFGGLLFAGFLATAIVLGWLMYPVPL